ncbi:amidase [Rathayibacter sp. AY1C3]|nr:amidase [Rathayibacter sp. AY1A4]PPG75843.1 amidase [Rathayibacter sp. AY1E5]PPH29240.1 amidase [Rathayibacter sp. AY1C3]PPH57937.1 amidase [Rathayibacter sp. AY1D7]PPI28618.1 amidase [Rathayibacter sp. AY1B4]
MLAASLTIAAPFIGSAPAFADTTTQTTTTVADSGRATGVTEAGNSGATGQCTWGAKEKFFEATGLRPAIYGNALDWDTSAAANGWSTVLDAQARSIVVFEPGVQGADSTYGHVAWVDSVEQRSDGLYINITEMNGAAGPGNFNARTVQDVVGMSYILAP